ncbi:MAG: hypothetical protein K8S27_16575, partial [Candidatus Omnitrophica bacterium]|nr:hypothetical protein [Candidatus Omnitrophota bacterium]
AFLLLLSIFLPPLAFPGFSGMVKSLGAGVLIVCCGEFLGIGNWYFLILIAKYKAYLQPTTICLCKIFKGIW